MRIAEITRVKQEVDGEILVYASYELVRALLDAGLVDELRLVVYPLDDLSDARDQQVFAEGLGREIQHRLATLPGLTLDDLVDALCVELDSVPIDSVNASSQRASATPCGSGPSFGLRIAPAAFSISIASSVITLVSREIYTPRRGLSGDAVRIPASTGIDMVQHIY